MTEMDTLTLDELMDHYGQDVWNFAFFLTRNRSLADDIAQDVFLKAYVHIESFRAESSYNFSSCAIAAIFNDRTKV